MDPIIIDNFLPESYATEIEHTLTQVEFDWHYVEAIAHGYNSIRGESEQTDPKTKETRGFAHRFYFEGQKLSSYCDFIRPILYFAEKHIPVNKIERMRGVLIPKDPSLKDFYNAPHVDFNSPHYTLIYYVNDCDSGTILFKEKYDYNKVWPDGLRKTEDMRVESKRNRALIFDGATYHTGIFPSDKDKFLININFS